MDSRLYIILSTNSDGNLVVTDNTDYSEWSTDVSNHTAVERLLDNKCNVMEVRTSTISNPPENNVWDLVFDGMYTYQKLILPTYGHEGDSDCYYDDGKFYLNGEEVTFDDIWKVKSENMNVFWFDDVFFSIYNLVKCFVITEKNRLDNIFNNSCRITCTDNPDAANADFLASAIFVLRYMIKNNNYVSAQELLNRLQVCNGLCKNVRKSLKTCGCGND